MGRYSSYRSDSMHRLYQIGGADLALRYAELSDRTRGTDDGGSYRPETPPSGRQRFVYVNGMRLAHGVVDALEGTTGTIADGHYWYDPVCGAWGLEGGPCGGFVQPGLGIGGRLRPDASGGGSGIYVNGRELHPLEAIALRRMGPLPGGRYWLDAYGNLGWEQGPMIANIANALSMR